MLQTNPANWWQDMNASNSTKDASIPVVCIFHFNKKFIILPVTWPNIEYNVIIIVFL